MFVTPDGEKIFVIDGHVHWWNGTAANQRNRHGEEFIQCFFEYHQALTHPDFLTDRSRFDWYSPDKMYHDLFVDGYDDMAIFQPTYLKAFYVDGFNTTERNALLWRADPERYILNGSF